MNSIMYIMWLIIKLNILGIFAQINHFWLSDVGCAVFFEWKLYECANLMTIVQERLK